MAKTPPATIDFAPAWLNFNTNSKVTKQNKSADHHTVSSYLGKTSQNRPNQFLWSGSDQKAAATYSNAADCGHWPAQNGLNVQTESNSQWSPLYYARAERKVDASIRKLDLDFPSLGTNVGSTTSSSPVIQSKSMWSKPLVVKVQDSNTASEQELEEAERRFDQTTSIYKSLVPKANIPNNKPSYRRTVSVPSSLQREDNRHAGTKDLNATSKHTTAFSKKIASPAGKRSPHSQGRKIIPQSAAVAVSQRPAMLALTVKHNRRGKNPFLSETKGDEACLTDEDIQQQPVENTPKPKNLHEDVKLFQPALTADRSDESYPKDKEQPIDYWDEVSTTHADRRFPICTKRENNDYATSAVLPPLSSSLEAEYRLLREMGWTEDRRSLARDSAAAAGGVDEVDETDEDGVDQPLTDDEIREFFTRNKCKGLLSVPSVSHRSSAFRNALNTWSVGRVGAGEGAVRFSSYREVATESLQDGRSSPESQLSFSDSD